MGLVVGSCLGPYLIESAIGAGGMGEVYRARDTKLHREVAIKVLPELFASDPERLGRFEREAKTLAALNHTHIAAARRLGISLNRVHAEALRGRADAASCSFARVGSIFGRCRSCSAMLGHDAREIVIR